MSRATRIVVDKLIYDLQSRPRDFKCEDYHLTDKKNNFRYYVGFSPGISHPYKMDFGIIQGWRLSYALNKWKAWTNVNALEV